MLAMETLQVMMYLYISWSENIIYADISKHDTEESIWIKDDNSRLVKLHSEEFLICTGQQI